MRINLIFSQISNITILFNTGNNCLTRHYDSNVTKEIDLFNKYFFKLIKGFQANKDNTSGIIPLKKIGNIVYKVYHNSIILTHIKDSQIDDFDSIEISDLIIHQLEQKFPDLFTTNNSQFPLEDIGNAIDNILGLNSHIYNQFQIKSFQYNPKITSFDEWVSKYLIKEIIIDIDLNNTDLYIFYNLMDDVNLYVQNRSFSSNEKEIYLKLSNELKKYIIMENWLKN